ncbi:MAG: response regulator [Alphaproteobacteria bacterium]|nr:response regulator [Alphaproteobacteria bacterium]
MLDGVKVLVVEDEPLIAMELALTIEEAGGVVAGSVRSLTEAIEAARTTDFDVALLDVRMRDGTTFSVAKILSVRKIPFLFCTGDSEQRDEFRDWPDVPLVSKPHKPENVIAVLSKLLANRR